MVLLRLLAAIAAFVTAAPVPAFAVDICGQLTWHTPRVVPVSLADNPLAMPLASVQLTFVGHATFLIESPGGVRIATDYNDYVKPAVVPEIATMNRAHRTHFTDTPDPGIAHVLRGWDPAGGVAHHDLTVGDVRVRNVPTNIRRWLGEAWGSGAEGGTIRAGNSIFVFEAAGLCVVHLGHLHHTLAPEQVQAIGKVDVLLVPVDGNYTLDDDGMFEVIEALEPAIIVPMHFFGPWTLERFLTRAAVRWPIERRDSPVLALTRRTLPPQTQVIVLPGR